MSETTDPALCRVCGKVVRMRVDNVAGTHADRNGVLCSGTYRPPAGDSPCGPSCVAVGTIGWPLSPARGEAHASTHVCDSPSHQDEARAWVHNITGHAGVFRTFAEARRH